MMQPIKAEAVQYPFTPREFERLAVYRAAIAVGFYTDWREDTKRFDGRSAAASAGAGSPAAAVS
jgi:hypothetical protein